MNKKIGTLANDARGKAWRSRLVPYEADICRLRLAGDSYRAIAKWMAAQGLIISASAIHGFVRARARRGRGQYALPETAATAAAEARADLTVRETSLIDRRPVSSEKPVPGSKAFVFMPKRRQPSRYSAEELEINDPLA